MPYPGGNNPEATDRELIEQMARWMRKHDVPWIGDEDGDAEENRTIELLEWLAESAEVLNLPARMDAP